MKEILILLLAFYLLSFSLSFRLKPGYNLSNIFKRSNFIRPIVFLNGKLPTENENKLLDERIQYFVPRFIAKWALGTDTIIVPNIYNYDIYIISIIAVLLSSKVSFSKVS